MISMTKLAEQTVTVADFGLRAFGLPCGKASGLSLAGARVDATSVRVADAVVEGAAFAAPGGNGLGAWDARRPERAMSASVVKLSALAGGYGDATGAGTPAMQQSQQHQLHLQKFAATAMTIQALRGPEPWIDRT
ncbi:hypothetical protein ABH931_001334 [Streptacidiphilus sp. MAP12-33]|uniref:hypothetical protein n=1 Tax=Streptacidiphilus sp. MAP12-33 TaxID=3156266 RepID=UPI0035189AB3